jgi:hypothetical protein
MTDLARIPEGAKAVHLDHEHVQYCPYCGKATITDFCPDWQARSLEDATNEATLQEYQCTGLCEGRSFWA